MVHAQKRENDDGVEKERKKYKHDPWTCTINLLSLSQFFCVAHTFFMFPFFFTFLLHCAHNANCESVKNKVQREYIFRFCDQKRSLFSLFCVCVVVHIKRIDIIYTLLLFLRDNSFKFTTLFIEHSSPSIFQCEKDPWFSFSCFEQTIEIIFSQAKKNMNKR